MKNIAVFASGNGTNFSAIARAVKNGRIKANLALLVCDQPDAFVIKRAKAAKVKAVLIKREDFSSNCDFELKIIEILKENKIDLIVLAGFMRIIGKELLETYKNRIINIHPALLPSFKGAHGIKDAFNYGVKVTGVTVHFVTNDLDGGPVILQEPVPITNKDTLKSLEEKIHKVEHELYPQAISLILRGKMKLKGRKVIIQ
ncbi:MAG: phosphoribosylglycinamide formyltransferase [Candidatus Omnitrophica bacterium]|nr:phosphoribosylglycinamide formyltransferase [Candidatus Omnitrophota bacterium]